MKTNPFINKLSLDGHEQHYFIWLCEQIHLEEAVRMKHLGMFILLHKKEFIWLVPHDDNRVADGYALRDEYMKGVHHAFPFGVSVLEVLVGLSRRVAFQTEGEPEWWAWKLIENLGLDKFEGSDFTVFEEEVDEILDKLVDRTYKPNGEGGFFPLKSTDEDQTKVEIWKQMSTYVVKVVGI